MTERVWFENYQKPQKRTEWFEYTKPSSYRVLDLFAGMGGIRLAFEQAGATCVYSSEVNGFARHTYHDNFGAYPENIDIRLLDPDDIPPFDVLTAGFPCQPFSKIGDLRGFFDDRANLFFDILRIVDRHRPLVLFFENVKNLLHHDDGYTFNRILQEIKARSYRVFYTVLNARDYGLPQSRERVYIVCWRLPDFQHIVRFRFPERTKDNTVVGNILEEVVHQRYTLSDAGWAGLQRKREKNKGTGNSFSYQMVTPQSPYLPTVLSRFNYEILIEQPGKNPRILTPREAARAQGFPDSFVLPSSDKQMFFQIGNSVAVPLVRRIAEKLIATLNGSAPIEQDYDMFGE